jgi:hypothetical protein
MRKRRGKSTNLRFYTRRLGNTTNTLIVSCAENKKDIVSSDLVFLSSAQDNADISTLLTYLSAGVLDS